MPKLSLLKKILFRNLLYIKEKFKTTGWTTTNLFVIICTVFAIIAISYNIYLNISKASQNYQVLDGEKQKLQEIKKQNEQYTHLSNYYDSLEYKQRYAYDSLGMVKKGEEIYIVEKDERENYEVEKANYDPIKKENKELWWDLIWKQLIKDFDQII